MCIRDRLGADQSRAKAALGSAFAGAQTKPEQTAVANAFTNSLNENWLGSKQNLDTDKFAKLLAAYQNTIPKNQINNPYDINATFGNPVPDVQYP